MIKILASLGTEEAFMISAQGHAQAARNENEHDLVCCAVSTLLGTLANSCAWVGDVNVNYQTSSGNGLVTVTNISDDLWGEIASRFRMAMDGLEVLREQYPESLKISME